MIRLFLTSLCILAAACSTLGYGGGFEVYYHRHFSERSGKTYIVAIIQPTNDEPSPLDWQSRWPRGHRYAPTALLSPKAKARLGELERLYYAPRQTRPEPAPIDQEFVALEPIIQEEENRLGELLLTRGHKWYAQRRREFYAPFFKDRPAQWASMLEKFNTMEEAEARTATLSPRVIVYEAGKPVFMFGPAYEDASGKLPFEYSLPEEYTPLRTYRVGKWLKLTDYVKLGQPDAIEGQILGARIELKSFSKDPELLEDLLPLLVFSGDEMAGKIQLLPSIPPGIDTSQVAPWILKFIETDVFADKVPVYPDEYRLYCHPILVPLYERMGFKVDQRIMKLLPPNPDGDVYMSMSRADWVKFAFERLQKRPSFQIYYSENAALENWRKAKQSGNMPDYPPPRTRSDIDFDAMTALIAPDLVLGNPCIDLLVKKPSRP